MATLLPSLSSDEEKDTHDDSEEEEIDDINQDFVFGGLLVRGGEEVTTNQKF